jgi:hypothetical protein
MEFIYFSQIVDLLVCKSALIRKKHDFFGKKPFFATKPFFIFFRIIRPSEAYYTRKKTIFLTKIIFGKTVFTTKFVFLAYYTKKKVIFLTKTIFFSIAFDVKINFYVNWSQKQNAFFFSFFCIIWQKNHKMTFSSILYK